MNITKKSPEELHRNHKRWNNELSFFSDEIKIYEHKLEDLVKNNTETKMLRGLEQFQNKFIRQKEIIDTLKHEVKILDNGMRKYFDKGNGSFNLPENYIENCSILKDKIIKNREIFNDTKHDFFDFLAEW